MRYRYEYRVYADQNDGNGLSLLGTHDYFTGKPISLSRANYTAQVMRRSNASEIHIVMKRIDTTEASKPVQA